MISKGVVELSMCEPDGENRAKRRFGPDGKKKTGY